MRKQDLICAMHEEHGEERRVDFRRTARSKSCPTASAFLRSPETSYLASTDDIYVSPSQIPPLQPAHRRLDRGRDPHPQGRRALLRAGQGRQGQRRAPEAAKNKILFET